MSWFMKEINETQGRIQVCLLDGRLITGMVVGIIGTTVLNLRSGDEQIAIDEDMIADYILV